MSISLSEFFTKIQHLKLNALRMVITTQLSTRDICSHFPAGCQLIYCQLTSRLTKHIWTVLPEDCWIALLGALKQWWLSVLERARWWSSKYREKSAPYCGKDQFSNCSVHSYAYDLFCTAYIEVPRLWIQAVFKQQHKNAAVSIFTRGQFRET